ncbi:MAG TPA: hypothetical protein VI893_08190, partial [Thermoplasmata archaeon]|nr:hypothetical protein [Thermoplasmata archaeon]
MEWTRTDREDRCRDPEDRAAQADPADRAAGDRDPEGQADLDPVAPAMGLDRVDTDPARADPADQAPKAATAARAATVVKVPVV